MHALALYCKSYSVDVRRLVRLARSVAKFNAEGIAFYVSVPAADRALFAQQLGDLPVQLLDDERIIAANPVLNQQAVASLPGHLSQQIVKSEFWRLDLCESYVCLDSDAFFIRPFTRADFMAANGTPYTVMDEAHDILENALLQKRDRVVSAFQSEADLVQKMFDRQGKRYNFGPFPLVWHRAVWASLAEHYLQPRGLNFADAIAIAPTESRWYGEALLAFKAIDLLPSQQMFKVYHYAWQKDRDFRAGMNMEILSRLYSGAIYQSAWERELDWPDGGGNRLSRWARKLRRTFGRI